MTVALVPEFHACGLPLEPCTECGESRCYACDPYRPEGDCGGGPLLLEVSA